MASPLAVLAVVEHGDLSRHFARQERTSTAHLAPLSRSDRRFKLGAGYITALSLG